MYSMFALLPQAHGLVAVYGPPDLGAGRGLAA